MPPKKKVEKDDAAWHPIPRKSPVTLPKKKKAVSIPIQDDHGPIPNVEPFEIEVDDEPVPVETKRKAAPKKPEVKKPEDWGTW